MMAETLQNLTRNLSSPNLLEQTLRMDAQGLIICIKPACLEMISYIGPSVKSYRGHIHAYNKYDLINFCESNIVPEYT